MSLVDKPAVNKATYVKMRRAPDGHPVITGPDNPTQETEDMRNIRRVAAYHGDNAETPGETGAGQEPQEGAPPAGEQDNAPTGEQESAAEGQRAPKNGAETAAAPPSEMAESIMQMFRDQMTAFLDDEVKPLVETAVAPLRQSVLTLERRRARFSGSGAWPSGRTASSPNDGESQDTPTWTNFGSKPRSLDQRTDQS